ncbi:hypothetical protein MHY12_05210, partial [Escherichia coli]|uniref:hypothetical protein n=1 Tax=Escherichia coli TaxID=562 RepID=UPI0021C0E729
ADRNRSHWSTSKTPSYTKSVSWQHHPLVDRAVFVTTYLMISWRAPEHLQLSMDNHGQLQAYSR